MVLQVFSEKHSNRLQYTLDVLFSNILGIKYNLIHSEDELNNKQAILNYSTTEISNSLQIIPHSLLFEEDIKVQNIKIEDEYYFFKTSEKQYDILASSFYMISRYEEYLPSTLDNHQRFKAEETLAYKNSFLEKAVVNRWVLELKNKLSIQFPQLPFSEQNFSYLSTIDIDNAYAYKSKGFQRLLGGFAKAILRGDKDDLKARLKYIFTGKDDPFDVYDKLENLHRKYKTKTLFFFLVGKNGPLDKNISIQKLKYQRLIQGISRNSKIGIHPSYQSNNSVDILKEEVLSLNQVIKEKIKYSRQHFLKLSFPETYRNLLKVGVTEDYTMGFASQIGFRAGICTPYLWFDLEQNKTTNLKITPFQVMDGTLNDYLQKSPQEALELIRNIQSEVKNVNGLFVTLWHNESLSKMRQWKNWENVYQEVLSISNS